MHVSDIGSVDKLRVATVLGTTSAVCRMHWAQINKINIRRIPKQPRYDKNFGKTPSNLRISFAPLLLT